MKEKILDSFICDVVHYSAHECKTIKCLLIFNVWGLVCSGLLQVAGVIGAVAALRVVLRYDWHCVMSWREAVSYVLLEPAFVQSFKCRVCYNSLT